MNPKRILADLTVFGTGYVRNPIGLFFSLAFPIILIVLFGYIFGHSNSSAVPLTVENLDHHSNASVAFLAALNATGVVQVNVVDPQFGNFSDYLTANDHTVGLVIPAGFDAAYRNHSAAAVDLFTDPADPSSSGTVDYAVAGTLNAFNLRAFGGTPFLSAHAYQVGSPVYKYIDYLVPGLIGFSILTSPMFAMVDITSTYRKEGLFRQLSLTPLTKGEWLASKIGWYVLLTFVSAALMVGIGEAAFGAHVTLTLGLVPFLVLGPFLFVSLGMLAGSVAKSPESAAVIGNIVSFPMMFLSGTFFPVSGFSPPLQTVAHALPLFYVIDGMNQVMLYNNVGHALTDAAIISVSCVVVFVAAITAFRWRES
ncbi:MAG: ABC transporter permease [Candidatus Lutacidiplasmatales archaeon]